MANEQTGTMREHMTALSSYRPPNPDGSFPPPQAPQGIPSGAVAANYPPGVASVSAYLPAGPTQLPDNRQPALPHTQQPQTNCAPFYVDPETGYLVDAQTRGFLPREHPAYQYPQAYHQYRVAPPAELQQPPMQQPSMQQPPMQQPPMQQATGPSANGYPGSTYPAYSPHSGPNAPEQNADPSQIPQGIPAPALQVAGAGDAPKRRGRRTKAEIEAARLAGGGGPRVTEREPALGGEQLAFTQAVSGALSNPNIQINAVTADQLMYVGNLARQAFNRTFGVSA